MLAVCSQYCTTVQVCFVANEAHMGFKHGPETERQNVHLTDLFDFGAAAVAAAQKNVNLYG